MASGKLILKGKPNSTDKIRLYLKFSHKGSVALVQSPELIRESELDSHFLSIGQFQLIPTAHSAERTNKRLTRLYTLLTDTIDEFTQRKPNSFTVADMKAYCMALAWWKENNEKGRNWKSDFEAWISHRKKNEAAADNTIRTYQSALTGISDFLEKKKLSHITTNNLTPELINAWIDYQLKEGKDPSSVAIMLSPVKQFCQFFKHPVINKDWKPGRKLTYIKKQGVALNEKEIKQLYDFEPPHYLQPTKDLLFRFIAAGVRWSDQHIDILARHGEFILKRSKKNSGLSAIPISRYLQEILDKPKPDMLHGTFNKNVKKLCELAGIDTPVIKETAKGGKLKQEVVPKWEMVSSKIGRKSLVSLLSLAGFQRHEIRQIIGNSVELEAYQVPDFEELAKKVQENMGGKLG